MVTTGEATTIAIHMENNKQVFPCRCGKTHRGDYAQEDWAMHQCLHDTDLMLIGNYQAICPLCGASWKVAPSGG